MKKGILFVFIILAFLSCEKQKTTSDLAIDDYCQCAQKMKYSLYDSSRPQQKAQAIELVQKMNEMANSEKPTIEQLKRRAECANIISLSINEELDAFNLEERKMRALDKPELDILAAKKAKTQQALLYAEEAQKAQENYLKVMQNK